MTKICSIDGCGNGSYGRGWCKSHYMKALKQKTFIPKQVTAIGAPMAWLKDHITHSGDECLPWPFTTNPTYGYGIVRVNGKLGRATREMCKYTHGLPPTPKHEAAHSCGNGHLGCVNPKHLFWKTHAENMADCFIHNTTPRGTKHGMNKLSEGDVRKIRAAIQRGTMNKTRIAAQFGVDRSAVSHIARGKAWAWLP